MHQASGLYSRNCHVNIHEISEIKQGSLEAFNVRPCIEMCLKNNQNVDSEKLKCSRKVYK